MFDMPETPLDFNAIWRELKDTVSKMLKDEEVEDDIWSDCVTAVYIISTSRPQSYAQRLYDEISDLLENHVNGLVEELKSSSGTESLKKYHSFWTSFYQAIDRIDSMCTCYNRVYATNHESSKTIIELCLYTWGNVMLDPIKCPIINYIINTIIMDKSEEEEQLDINIAREIIKSYFIIGEQNSQNEMEIYRTAFETPFLEILRNYYLSVVSKYVKRENVKPLIQMIINGIQEQDLKTFEYLHEETARKIGQCFIEVIIEIHGDWLLLEAENMIKELKENELELMYTLFKLLKQRTSPFMVKLINCIYCKIMGYIDINSLQGEKGHLQFVEKLFRCRRVGMKLIQKYFESDREMINALEEALMSVVNYHADKEQLAKGSELIAKHCDYLLKKPVKNEKMVRESDIKEQLNRTLLLLRYIQEKDLFQKIFMNMLAKRLFRQLSVSLDLEKHVLDSLRLSYGTVYTYRLDKMLADMTVSPELNSKFKKYMQLKGTDESTIDFSVNVLQSSIWPLAKQDPISLRIPRELENLLENFNIFYKSECQHKKFDWLHSLSHGELQFNYLRKPYLVTVHTFQMAILLLFENRDSIICDSMAEFLQLTHDETVNQLTSLISSNILKKSTEGEIDKNTVLSLNFDYYNRRKKFKIGIIPPKQSQDSKESQNTDTVQQSLSKE